MLIKRILELSQDSNSSHELFTLGAIQRGTVTSYRMSGPNLDYTTWRRRFFPALRNLRELSFSETSSLDYFEARSHGANAMSSAGDHESWSSKSEPISPQDYCAVHCQTTHIENPEPIVHTAPKTFRALTTVNAKISQQIWQFRATRVAILVQRISQQDQNAEELHPPSYAIVGRAFVLNPEQYPRSDSPRWEDEVDAAQIKHRLQGLRTLSLGVNEVSLLSLINFADDQDNVQIGARYMPTKSLQSRDRTPLDLYCLIPPSFPYTYPD